MRRYCLCVIVLMLTCVALAGQSSPRERRLFDGKTTNGWRGFKKAAFPEKGWVVAVDTFDNFDLTFEWQVALGANSGVKYLVTEDRSGPVAHEYHILLQDHGDEVAFRNIRIRELPSERHERVGPAARAATLQDLVRHA